MSWHTLRPLAAPFRPGQLPLRTIQLCASVGKEKSAEKSLWHKAVIQKNTMAAEELHLLECEVPIEIAQSYHTPGQYIMLRRDDSQEKPGFFAITSPPPLDGHDGGCFELLVKQVDATQWLCERQRGSFVELSAAQGRGFPTRERFHNAIRHVLLFATGSGIAPIRAAIEDRGCLVGMDSIKLYYGCRNQNRMAYQDRFASWQKDRGVQVVPVLSQPVSSWNGARGYVQHALERDGILTPPAQTAVLVCGLRGMTTAVESYLLQHGIEKQHILYNF
jgi:ferredoxin-NADP reductase